ncbi:unnamed protein product [Larinioides sclopetarius]
MLEDVSLFYRFAKARDFNLTQAEAMLRKHIAWRKEIKMDTILTEYEPPEVLKKYTPLSFTCFDKEGCAVLFHDLGRADAKGFNNVATNMEILKYVVYYVETCKDRVIKHGGNGKKRFELGKPILSPIYDFDELTYSKAVNVKTLQLILLIVQTFIDNHPELLRIVTVINAPFYFTWMYSSLKHILPSTVIRKVRIFGSDGWKEALLEDIEADDLPVYLGGNRRDPDGNPFCESFMIRGQLIPKKYYMKKGRKNLSSEPDVEKIKLMPFCKEEITFKVEEGNSFLEWEFQTSNRDIDFSLVFRGKSQEDFGLIEIIPKQRIDTTIEPEKGVIKCEKVGDYSIVFDNSNSWIHSKEVHYRAGIKSSKIKELLEST